MADPAFIQDVPTRDQYTAAAAQTIFDYTFPIFDEVDLVIEKTQISDGVTIILVLTTDYTVTGVGAQAGGTIVLTSGAAAGDIITITRQVELKRITDFSQEAAFNSANVNLELNRMVQMIQDRDRDIAQSMRIPDADINSPANDIPDEVTRIGRVLGFDPFDSQPVVGPTIAELQIVVDASGSELVLPDMAIVTNFGAMQALTLGNLTNGDMVQTKDYFDVTEGGGNIYQWREASTDTPDNGSVAALSPDSGTGRFFAYNPDRLSLKQFGCRDTLNSTTALANAFAWSENKVLELSQGTFLTDAPVKIPSAAILVSGGVREDACVIKATAALAATTPPTLTGIHTPTPDFPPVMYCDGIQWFKWDEFMIDGDDLDVIGMFMNEAFIGKYNGIRVSNTNQNPLVLIRVQNVHFDQPSCFLCGQGTNGDGGVLAFDTSDLVFTAPNFERLGGDNCRYSLEIRQNNNKGSWTIINPWFETVSVGKKPTEGHMAVSGRLGRVSGHFAGWDSATTESVVDLLDASGSITRHGVTMGISGAKGWDIDINDTSSSLFVVAGAGTNGNVIRGFFVSTKITENSVPGENQFLLPDTIKHPHFIETFEVRKAVAAGSLPVGVNDYRFKVNGLEVLLFGNSNNSIKLNSGQLDYSSNSNMRFFSINGSISHTPAAGFNVSHNFSAGGTLFLGGIPTASAGLTAGEVWRNGNVLTIIQD